VEQNIYLTTNPKEMEFCEFHDKEFKIISLKRLVNYKKNRDRQLNEIREMAYE
jgi:hypothetical protein